MRLAVKELGFSGYEALRHLFQTAIEQAEPGFQDRARWLQSLPKKGELGRLYADMAAVTIRNIETTLAASDAAQMEQAALALHRAKDICWGLVSTTRWLKVFVIWRIWPPCRLKRFPNSAVLPLMILPMRDKG